MLETLLKYYRKSDVATKKKIRGRISVEELVLKHRAKGSELRVQ